MHLRSDWVTPLLKFAHFPLSLPDTVLTLLCRFEVFVEISIIHSFCIVCPVSRTAVPVKCKCAL
jgi:hypothetical protein